MPTSTAPTRAELPRRDRVAILAGLGGVTGIAWIYLVWMALQMGAHDMGSLLEPLPWSALDFGLMFLMWAVMMVGMMVPTAAPTALVYAAVARKASSQGTPIAPTFLFVSGYVVAWTLFSVAATGAQWGLDRALLLSPMLVATSPLLGAGLLVAAGVYQLTPYKQACLRHCRAPAHFIAQHWRAGRSGALRMGIVHGAYCLGCCWALMGLLFFGGVMSLLWIAAISFFVLAEKLLPGGARGGRLAGFVLIALGVVVAIRA